MEVQNHGLIFEDFKIKEITGLSKTEYDNLKCGGYTSKFDLVNGIIVNKNYSIKTTKTSRIDCGDVLSRMKELDYILIIGMYKQVDNYKIFYGEYTFDIQPQHYKILWGNMTYEKVKIFDDFVKSIPFGKDGQRNTLTERKKLKNIIQCNKSFYKLNPKVDSKKQRRVQCSINLKDLIKSDIDYQYKSLNLKIQSKPRNKI